MSLTPDMRRAFYETLCETIRLLCRILQKSSETSTQNFRDAFASHIYMLYSFMFLTESHAANASKSQKISDALMTQRSTCTDTMLLATETMVKYKAILWQRGVADEAVVLLPCRSAYYLLERSTGVQARKALCGDQAMEIIGKTVEPEDAPLTPIVASLMDLLHSHEHMAALVAEIAAKMSQSERLAVELLREYGHLDGSGDARANGLKNIAPFVTEIAAMNPRVVFQQLPHLLHHFQTEAYHFRSSLVNAIFHVLEYMYTEEAKGPTQNEQEAEAESNTGSSNNRDFSKTRNKLLDLLAERVFDVSSFTRAAVLKVWVNLTVGKLLPKNRIISATRMAMDRLHDRTVLVRKQSMQLLTALLENNPFLGHLDPEPYRVKLQELYKEVMEHLPENLHEAQLQVAEGSEGDETEEVAQATLAAVLNEVQGWDEDDGITENQQQYKTKVNALQFTQLALEFIEVFEDATENLEGMILSANCSDVTEALRFFVQARHFQLPCAVTGIKRALALMWSSEQAIKDEVLKAFVEIFIAEPGTEGKELLLDSQIAKNLIALTSHATVSELASIEEAIVFLVKQERIPAGVFMILWSAASKSSGDIRAAAFQLIAMGARSDRTIVDSKSRLKLLLESGLGDYAEEHKNWKLVAAATSALHKVGRVKPEKDAKSLVCERIFEQLQVVIRGDWCDDKIRSDTEAWFDAADQAIKALFFLSPEPEKYCAETIHGMYQRTFSSDYESCHPLRLARFLHVCGSIALETLVYTEGLVSGVRRAQAKKSLKKQEDADRNKTTNQGLDDQDEAIEAELGLAAEAELENERMMVDISENEILNRNLLRQFCPLMIHVVSDESGKYGHEILQQAAVLALCKFMCVSSQFCEKHLPLLFSALSKSPEATIMKSNTVVALGDLAFRFPNEVEPYTPKLYACLRDPSIKIRRHTLMVLTHLLLNDMIKVKGNVSEVALCLEDNDQSIRDMSKLLFFELAKRSNNPVYNLLPEIVSQLIQMPDTKESFRSIMSFLLGFIKKERQNEMLAHKFLDRLAGSDTISQKSDIAFCIALLKPTEKVLKLLSAPDSIKLYKDTLAEPDAVKSFSSIITKAKKTLKHELRPLIDEWEARLGEVTAESQENAEAGARAKANRQRARRKQKALNAIEEEEEDESDTSSVDFDEQSCTDKENVPIQSQEVAA